MTILGTATAQAVHIQLPWSELFLRTVVQELDRFWGYMFTEADKAEAFHSPNVQWYTLEDEKWGVYEQSDPTIINTECGRTSVAPAVYCPADHSIHLDIDGIDRLIAATAAASNMDGDAVAVFIIAHEYAHAVQTMARISLQNPRKELQADCFAGLYIHHSQILQGGEDDLDEIAVGVLKAGDYIHDHANHHGSGMRRLHATMTGLQGNVQGCINAEF